MDRSGPASVPVPCRAASGGGLGGGKGSPTGRWRLPEKASGGETPVPGLWEEADKVRAGIETKG